MIFKSLLAALAAVIVVSAAGCGGDPGEEQFSELLSFPLDGKDGILQQSAEFDPAVSFDGKGSIRIQAGPGKSVIALLETGDIDVDDARLVYQAKVKTENLQKEAYLEMWVDFADQGQYFSRGLDNPIAESKDWTTLSTPFFLEKGQNPRKVSLNIVVNGPGTLWIDDIKLLKGPR